MKITGGKIFSVVTLVVFIVSVTGCLLWAPTSILDTHGREACAASPSASSGRIYLQIEGGAGGNFSMKGTVIVPVGLWPRDLPESQKGWIDLPDMSEDGQVHAPWVPLPASAPVKTEFESTAVYQIEVEQGPVGIGTLRSYPFDRYWVGFQSARLTLPGQSGQAAANIPLELHVRFDGEPGWDAERKIGVNGPYHEGFGTPYGFGDQSPSSGGCGLTIHRSPWYIGLVFSLLAIMAVPAAYVWRRRQGPAGLELIAAILGMATIRTYLIGSPSSIGSLLPFDVVLGLIICAVAFIPFWKPNIDDEK
jgi:hypothetical protein